LARSLIKLIDSLWVFLEVSGVEPTNNRAEPVLRFRLALNGSNYFCPLNMYKLNITAAITGSRITREITPCIPITPEDLDLEFLLWKRR
jgi:hypothetical protein